MTLSSDDKVEYSFTYPAQVGNKDTPWFSYTMGGSSTVASPTFNPNGGGFTNPVDVELSTSEPSSNIYYTLDGTAPNNLSTSLRR